MGSGQSLACDLTLNSALEPELRERFQNTAVIRDVLARTRTIAIVGLSSNRQKASHFVATYLEYAGYDIIPVNPTLESWHGRTAYPDLLSVPHEVDMVDVFRPGRECPTIASQAVEIGANSLWLQLRVISVEAAEMAEDAGIDVVMDRCIKMEHGRYNGSMHWVGMNTGIITAKVGRRWF
ncbi:MAG: CoA-binding protein [Rhodothermales bacterium]